jgi:hypothetical protein
MSKFNKSRSQKKDWSTRKGIETRIKRRGEQAEALISDDEGLLFLPEGMTEEEAEKLSEEIDQENGRSSR